jgi:uncharacterized membrane protein
MKKALIARMVPRGLLGTFFAGFLVLLPIIVTVLIISWLVGQVRYLFGPGSFFGDILVSAGSTIFGAGGDQLAFWIGMFIVLFGVWGIGLFVTLQARKTLSGIVDALFNRVPLLGAIYRPVAQVVRLLDTRGGGDLEGMQVVTARLGGEASVDTLALRASQNIFTIGGEARSLIYVPTAPIPMGGFLLLVATKNVTPVPDMDLDDLMKVYFSIGALASESLPQRLQNP